MEEIISRLVEARHKAKLSLEDITERTKIPLRQLEYLESYQFDKIGPSVYIKGFIRRYAQEVGIDEYSLWQHEDSKVVPVTPSRASRRRQRWPVHFNLAPILRFAVILALLVVAAFFIRTALENFFQSQPPAPPDPPSGHEDPGPEDEDPLEEPEPEPQVTIEELKADESEASYVVHNAQSLDVVLTFSGDCWTRFTVDEDRVSSATFRDGHVEELGDATVLRLRFGAPKFVTVTVNGKKLTLPDLQRAFNLEIRLAED